MPPLTNPEAAGRRHVLQVLARTASSWGLGGPTAPRVTRDVQEAVAQADRVILIEDGVIALDEHTAWPRLRSAHALHWAI